VQFLVRRLGPLMQRTGLAAAGWLLALTAVAAADPQQLWFDGARPSEDARAAVTLLAAAPTHGLDERDYGLPALRDAVQAAARDGVAPAAAARLGAALSAAMQRYLRDLHDGRIDPATLQQRYALPRRAPYDAQGALTAALAAHDLARAVREAAPALSQYERLREALAHERALGDHPAWRERLPALPWPTAGSPARRSPAPRQRALEPGAAWDGVDTLATRLLAMGDLAAAAASVAAATPAAVPAAAAAAQAGTRRYDDTLVAAVRAFQQRHGREADGVSGRARLAALQVTPAERAAQIALALERLRWTPVLAAPRMIVVNVPEFVLRAYEVEDGRVVVRTEMRVIVGGALRLRTPLIAEDLRRVEFNPYWNIPPSIARNETVPRLRRDPEYWTREGFEFVPVASAAGADTVLGAAKLDAVLAGRLRIRQRPGPRNALGNVKFVFPNRESIYLHHTPSVALFERARRDLSHGCIRVEHPVALARFVLAELPGWDEPRIRAAMAGQTPLTVTPARPLPVLIAYSTALVKGARVHFFDDIYGHDRALAQALRDRRRPPIDVP